MQDRMTNKELDRLDRDTLQDMLAGLDTAISESHDDELKEWYDTYFIPEHLGGDPR